MIDSGKKSFTDMLVNELVQQVSFDGQETSDTIRPVADAGFA